MPRAAKVVDGAKTTNAAEVAPKRSGKGKGFAVPDDRKTVVGGSDKWLKDPWKDIERVFRVKNPPCKEAIHTLLERQRVVAGTEFPAVSKSIAVNPAQQYVLKAGAMEYKKQLKALRNIAGIEEIDPACLGLPWVPPTQRKIKEHEDELRRLKASL